MHVPPVPSHDAPADISGILDPILSGMGETKMKDRAKESLNHLRGLVVLVRSAARSLDILVGGQAYCLCINNTEEMKISHWGIYKDLPGILVA